MRKILISTWVLCGLLSAGTVNGAPVAERIDPAALHLSDVDKLVAERNRVVVGARRQTAVAVADQTIAAARPNPVLSLNTSSYRVNQPAGPGSLDTVVRIDQTIERGNKRALRVAQANDLLAASRADEADSVRQQLLLARQAYFDLKAADDNARQSAGSAALAHVLLDKARLRLKAGDLAAADVARIAADTAKADADATLAVVDRRRSQLALARLLALEDGAARLAAIDPWPPLAPRPGAASSLAGRPDVIAARRRLAAAERAVELARAQQVRDVTIGVQVERDRSVGGNLLGLGVSIPLFTAYNYQGEVRKAAVERDAAADELARIEVNAAAEVAESGFEDEQLDASARQLSDVALPAARKALAAAQLAFIHGAASALDVIDARRSLHAVEIDTVNALANAAKAQAAWAASLDQTELP